MQSKDLTYPHEKKKGSLVEILVHSKNKALLSLPIRIKVEGEGE
jgi:hypothetical protein